ncbi:MAG: anti-sigma factor [Candidatus Binatia bacterium]
MTCREFVEFLWRYFSEELSPNEREGFDAHLAQCPHCLKYLQSYQETIHIGKKVFTDLEETLPHEVPEDLVKAILEARTKAA